MIFLLEIKEMVGVGGETLPQYSFKHSVFQYILL